MTLTLLSNALVFSFIVCCVVSAALQVLAWSRHARDGVTVSVRALWRPDAYFDEVGRQQIRVARQLLLVGAVAYLTYGLLIVMTNARSAAG